MNKEKPIRDQAERLRKRVERKSERKAEQKDTLPPRSELHRQKSKKTKVKVKYPVIRMMALVFILLPISFFSILSYLEGKENPLKKTFERAGVEMITVERKENGTNRKLEKKELAPVLKDDAERTEEIGPVTAAPAPSTASSVNSDKDSSAASASSSLEAGETILYHTVKPSETLFRVAMTYYKSKDGIEIIQKANNLEGNEIRTGQVLKIPIKN
ncbi:MULTISPECIES: LysM peptidoglycan-binding domain-containing protein [Mesobacillus]|uniref:LysM domain-containing protein n=2 Tax=Mesobacillus TaxID=2675231 RepID=A0A0D6Z7I9_9BACI|nr:MULTISPECIES: LysM peptidoglycan-binding domain-containing protein [Mesobacillus]KIY21275.1 hypothetical protein UB32_14655 [Mesobacillus subterraneus]MDQ0412147.1 LysM repeat protein [Mesobacillus stamsii]